MPLNFPLNLPGCIGDRLGRQELAFPERGV